MSELVTMLEVNRQEVHDASFAIAGEAWRTHADYYTDMILFDDEEANDRVDPDFGIMCHTAMYVTPGKLSPALNKRYFPSPLNTHEQNALLREEVIEAVTTHIPSHTLETQRVVSAGLRVACEEFAAEDDTELPPGSFKIAGVLAVFSYCAPSIIVPNRFYELVVDALPPPDTENVSEEDLRDFYGIATEHRDGTNVSFEEFKNNVQDFEKFPTEERVKRVIMPLIGSLLVPRPLIPPTLQKNLFEGA